METISIIKVLLLFYLLLGNSLLQPLLSKQWKKMVEENRLIQHLIGLTTMITLVVLTTEGENVDYLSIMVYSAVAYLWFIFSTKMDIHLNVMIMILLLGSYLYESHLKAKNNEAIKDKVLTQEQKNDIIEKNNAKHNYLMLGMMTLIVGGMMMYSQKKEVQYGGGKYKLINFLLY